MKDAFKCHVHCLVLPAGGGQINMQQLKKVEEEEAESQTDKKNWKLDW